MFDAIVGLVRSKLAANKAWQAFEATRRQAVRCELERLLAASRGAVTGEARVAAGPARGFGGDARLLKVSPADTDLVSAHLDAVLEAGFPLGEVVKLLGHDALLALAGRLKGGGR